MIASPQLCLEWHLLIQLDPSPRALCAMAGFMQAILDGITNANVALEEHPSLDEQLAGSLLSMIERAAALDVTEVSVAIQASLFSAETKTRLLTAVLPSGRSSTGAQKLLHPQNYPRLTPLSACHPHATTYD